MASLMIPMIVLGEGIDVFMDIGNMKEWIKKRLSIIGIEEVRPVVTKRLGKIKTFQTEGFFMPYI